MGAPSLRPGLPMGKFQGAKAATGPTGSHTTVERMPAGSQTGRSDAIAQLSLPGANLTHARRPPRMPKPDRRRALEERRRETATEHRKE
jgi:hypothetical protein